MNRSELADILYREGIRPYSYSLNGGRQDDTHVIDRRPEGWVVYYSERGEESSHHHFATEDEACRHLLEILRSSPFNFFQLVAGPLQPEAADAAFHTFLAGNGLSPDDFGPEDLMIDHIPIRPYPQDRRYFIRATRLPDRLRDKPRNMLRATVGRVGIGSGVAGVVVSFPDGQEVEALVPRDSAIEMNLEVGDDLIVMIRPTDVLVLKTDGYGESVESPPGDLA
ncbi:MAG: TOBE domain-containing protein [Actinomycetota bacterium]|nr:TOBE domain-containing protein [Actinomycetota bacterium]